MYIYMKKKKTFGMINFEYYIGEEIGSWCSFIPRQIKEIKIQ